MIKLKEWTVSEAAQAILDANLTSIKDFTGRYPLGAATLLQQNEIALNAFKFLPVSMLLADYDRQIELAAGIAETADITTDTSGVRTYTGYLATDIGKEYDIDWTEPIIKPKQEKNKTSKSAPDEIVEDIADFDDFVN